MGLRAVGEQVPTPELHTTAKQPSETQDQAAPVLKTLPKVMKKQDIQKLLKFPITT